MTEAFYEYNVDTTAHTRLDIGMRVSAYGSLTGIDVGVKCIFKDFGYDECL
eukprot:gnl/Chilomastix_caulleri/4704.p2 GENE.gnl/Chilomastix_caulleri/4704~~gnl/Chilomastix_caulleri/4704.p2  ORF type:complete len:51 (+),score=5.39 gnl/Chilomastix_caulleri/4704:92-244(+)